jgi:hypothetical protein
MIDTKIFSVFPACGKTYFFEHQDDWNLRILDSDSSQFSWMYKEDEWTERIIKVRNPEFPKNYIEHIKNNIGKYDYIFVSSHKEVRDALDEAGIEFTIVFPEYKCKEEWFGRCCIREIEGKNGFDSTVLLNNWDKWWYDCAECAETHNHIVLRPTEHLTDRLWIKDSFSGTWF